MASYNTIKGGVNKAIPKTFNLYDAFSGQCTFISLGLSRAYIETGQLPRLFLANHSNATINKNIPAILYSDQAIFAISDIIDDIINNPITPDINNMINILVKKRVDKTKASVFAYSLSNITPKQLPHIARLNNCDITIRIIWFICEIAQTGKMSSNKGYIKRIISKFNIENIDNNIIENTKRLFDDGCSIYTVIVIYKLIYYLNNIHIYKHINRFLNATDNRIYMYPKRIQDEVNMLNKIRKESYMHDSDFREFMKYIQPNINPKSQISALVNSMNPVLRNNFLSHRLAARKVYGFFHGGNQFNLFAFGKRNNLNIKVFDVNIDIISDKCVDNVNTGYIYDNEISYEFNSFLFANLYRIKARNLLNARTFQKRCSKPLLQLARKNLKPTIDYNNDNAKGVIHLAVQSAHCMVLIPIS